MTGRITTQRGRTSQRRPSWVVLGSLVFFVLAPGTVAGWVPFWLTGWRAQPLPPGGPGLPIAGAVLAVVGLCSLVESFARFAIVGLGTPAPVAAPTRLVVSGQYRHVRNPMYVAILAVVLGQGAILGRLVLLRYAALLWLGFHVWVLLYEEPRLAARFGRSYDVYRRNVRRWWPRIRPWSGSQWETSLGARDARGGSDDHTCRME